MVKKVRVVSRNGRGTAFAVVAVLFVLMAVGVLLAILFAPKKPEAPPSSNIAFEAKPKREAGNINVEPASFSGTRARRHRPEPKPTTPVANTADEAQEGRCILTGRVTEAKTGKPVENAAITYVATAIQDGQDVQKASRATTDKDGNYTLKVVIKGTYFIDASANGFLPGRQKVELEEDKTANADFVLSRGASISGRVTEKGSGTGASEVQVFSRGKRNAFARTDKDGRYTISGLVPGEYEVRLDVRGTPYLISGIIPTRNASVRFETQDVTGIDFTVDAAGQIWGYVTTREKSPIEADMVLCSSASMISQIADAGIRQVQPVTGRSDATGYYELSNIPLNKEWRVMAMPKESAPQLSAPFLLSSTQRTARVDMFVSGGSTVYGRVIDTDGKAVQEAEVICLPSYGKFFSPLDTPQAFRNATSEQDGSFTLPNLPVGEYQVIARKDKFKFAAMGQPIYPDGANDLRDVDIVLTPIASGNSTVYGTITDTSNTALSGVRVEMAMLGQSDLSAGGTDTETDANGAYRFDKVPEGFLMLTVRKDGYQQQNVTAVKLDEPTDIVMQSAAVISGIVLVRESNKPPTGTYSVVASLSNANGGPAMGMMLQGGRASGNFSDPEGKFSLTVGGGDYTVEARSAGLTPGREVVSVSPGQETANITLYLRESGGKIEGRVTTPDGKSPQGALVWYGSTANPAASLLPGMTSSSGQNNGIQVGADGAFAFSNLPADTYQLQAKLEGYAQGHSDPITLGDGQQATGITIALGYGCALQGTVQFNGYLEPEAFVGVVGNGVSELTSTDAEGRYHFDTLPAGVYLGTAMSLSAGGGIMGFFAPLHARIEIIEGQPAVYNFGEPTNTALEGRCVPAPPGGYLGYAVLQQPGAPPVSLNVANPMAWFQDQNGPWQYVMGMGPVTSAGNFRIDNLVEGDYQLDIFMSNIGEVVLGNMHQVYHGMVKIAAGQVLTMDFEVASPNQQ